MLGEGVCRWCVAGGVLQGCVAGVCVAVNFDVSFAVSFVGVPLAGFKK